MGRGKLSLKATIRLTMLLVAASVILTAAALFGAMRHQERRTFATQRAATIADLAGRDLVWQIGADARMPLTQWFERAAAWPCIEGLALLREGHAPLVHAPEPLAASLLAAANNRAGQAFTWTTAPPVAGKHLAIQTQIINAPELHARLLLALRLSNEPPAMAATWQFFAPLGMIGLVGVCIGILWLSHEVVRPIEMLAKVGTDNSLAGELIEPTSASRYAELASLAQTLRCLHINLDQWRSKADQLEKSFDKRVAEETRKINQTLQRTKREMWRDPLTGLYNRRMLEENGPRLFDEQRSSGGDFSMIMLDVDHFKTLNDTLGHMAGDEMLQFVAQLLKQAIRREDYAVRYGGDEFQLLLPGVAIGEAAQIAERVVSLFRQHSKLLISLDPKPSLSAGVTSLAVCHARDLPDLMRMADDALYQAKRAGKNRVGFYDPNAPKGKHSGAGAASAPAAAKGLVGAGKRMLSAMF
jgi:diguanylate cyclase (GGDEF)-like protein